MTRSNTPKRPSAGVPGAKLLITTTALAAALGGWATFAQQEPDPPTAPDASPSEAQISVELPQQRRLQFAPIPTLVPLASPQAVAIARAPTIHIASEPAAQSQPAPAAPAAPVAPVAVAPVAPVAAPPLRAVSAPPAPARAAAPVARTRSSR